MGAYRDLYVYFIVYVGYFLFFIFFLLFRYSIRYHFVVIPIGVLVKFQKTSQFANY